MTPEELMARIDAMSDEQVGALWEHLRQSAGARGRARR